MSKIIDGQSMNKKLEKMSSDAHWDGSISNKPFTVPREVLDHLKAASYSVSLNSLVDQ